MLFFKFDIWSECVLTFTGLISDIMSKLLYLVLFFMLIFVALKGEKFGRYILQSENLEVGAGISSVQLDAAVDLGKKIIQPEVPLMLLFLYGHSLHIVLWITMVIILVVNVRFSILSTCSWYWIDSTCHDLEHSVYHFSSVFSFTVNAKTALHW